MRERAAHDLGLLVNFLRHEMAMLALVDQKGRGLRADTRALDPGVRGVVEFGALAGQHDPVAFVQISDVLREGRERQRIGAEKHLALAPTDGERRTAPRADEQVRLALEQEGERKSAAQLRQGGGDRLDRGIAALHFFRNQMGDDFRVGLGVELVALATQRLAQFAEILDNAVVNDGDALIGVRMRVGFVGAAVRRPAGVADAAVTLQRLAGEPIAEIAQLAFGAAAREMAVFQSGDAG